MGTSWTIYGWWIGGRLAHVVVDFDWLTSYRVKYLGYSDKGRPIYTHFMGILALLALHGKSAKVM